MKKSPLLFLSLVGLALCSFVLFESQQAAAPPVKEAVYKQYLSLFTKVELPYKISLANQHWKKKEALGMSYAPFIPHIKEGLFERAELSTYYPEVMLMAGQSFNVVIYVETSSWDGEIPHFHIQTLDKKGKVIAKFHLVKFAKDSNSYCEISKNLSILTYDSKTKKTQTLQVDKSGKISITKAG